MSDELSFGPEAMRYSTVEAHDLPGFDAGYAQAIKDVVEDDDLREKINRVLIDHRVTYRSRAVIFKHNIETFYESLLDDLLAAIRKQPESRFSAPSPGPEGEEE